MQTYFKADSLLHYALKKYPQFKKQNKKKTLNLLCINCTIFHNLNNHTAATLNTPNTYKLQNSEYSV